MAGKTDRTAININSIARQAHVSTTTVSNLINSTEVFPISPETRERILRVMRELNYRPHIGAGRDGFRRAGLAIEDIACAKYLYLAGKGEN